MRRFASDSNGVATTPDDSGIHQNSGSEGARNDRRRPELRRVPLRRGEACDLRVRPVSLNSGFNGLVPGAARLPGTPREVIRVPASTAPAGSSAAPASNAALIRRMLALSWRYRWG